MKWNIAPEAISLVILSIIWVYSRKGSHLPSLKNRMFQGCLMITFGAMATNILSTVMIYNYRSVPIWITWLVTSVYFVLTPLMGQIYYFYTISIIYTEHIQLKRMMILGSIPGIVYLLLVLVNPFNKCLFDISMEEGYTRGSLIAITYIIFYAYCVACIFVTVSNHKKLDRKIYKILAAFPALAVVVIIVQQIYPDVILSGSAATCAILIIYLHLQNKQISLDYMTNIPNHQELQDMIALMLRKTPEKAFTLMVVSIRDFRQVNNACGQQTGDAFLKAVSSFLCSVGPQGNVYRFNGDEFALLFSNESTEQIKECVRKIQDRMQKHWQIGDYRFTLPVVIGAVHHSNSGETLEKIISSIEYAVSQAKTGKYGQICYCDDEMLSKLSRRRQVIDILKDKLADESFEMYYQPIYCMESGKFPYAESLMRINDTPIGPVYPSEFIPIAEETGLIVDITYVVLKKICGLIRRLKEEGLEIGSVHVNFSAEQFTQTDLKERVLKTINEFNIPLSAVKIEFTESVLAENPQVVTDFSLDMEKYGIMMGLDDFGTGYSNIATVINIPFGTLKLDKSLVWAAMESQTSALVIKNLVRTFKDMGIAVIAEGVETEEQMRAVADFGVAQIQGFYYSRPLPEEEYIRFLREKNKEEISND